MEILKRTNPFVHWRDDISIRRIVALNFPKIFGKLAGHIPYDQQDVMMRCPHNDQLDICGRGVGKSSVLETQGMAGEASTMPFLKAAMNKLDRPVKFTGLFIAPTKEQSFELQSGMADVFDETDWLHSLKSGTSTKTNLILATGRGPFARVLIRPATGSARGQHAKTKTDKETGEVTKGLIRIKIDEGWHLRQDRIIEDVIGPMTLIGGRGTGTAIYTTPYGKTGEVWAKYDAPTTGRCLQRYTLVDGYKCFSFTDDLEKEVLDGFGAVDVSQRTAGRVEFSPQRCVECMNRFKSVIHNAPSVENPYANKRKLLADKRALTSSGRTEVWRQEYLGIPESTRGLFFTEEDQRLMFDDTLLQYRLNDYGELVKLILSGAGEAEETALMPENYDGEFYLGLDGSQGVETARADFAGISLGQLITKHGKPFAALRLCERFRVTDGRTRYGNLRRNLGQVPDRFNGVDYRANEVLPFLIAYAVFIVRRFGVKKIYIDQGAGQALYVPLVQIFGEQMVEYIKTSVQEKMRCLLHLRSMIQTKRAASPMIEFLMREAKYLEVDEDSLEDDKIKVKKAKGWGSSAAQVDGIFSWAYMMRGTEKAAVKASLGVVEQIDLTRYGPPPVRELGRPVDIRERMMAGG